MLTVFYGIKKAEVPNGIFSLNNFPTETRKRCNYNACNNDTYITKYFV